MNENDLKMDMRKALRPEHIYKVERIKCQDGKEISDHSSYYYDLENALKYANKLLRHINNTQLNQENTCIFPYLDNSEYSMDNYIIDHDTKTIDGIYIKIRIMKEYLLDYSLEAEEYRQGEKNDKECEIIDKSNKIKREREKLKNL